MRSSTTASRSTSRASVTDVRAATLAALGAALLMPATAPAQAPLSGVVTGLQGSASIVRAATAQRTALAFKDEIAAGDQITTAPRSQVRVLFSEGAVVTVYPQASLTVGAAPGGSPLTLTAGSVRYHIMRDRMPAGAVYEVRTPNAVVRLRGPVLHVEYQPTPPLAPGPLTRVCVLSGMVSASTLGGEVMELGPDQCADVGERTPPPPSPPPLWRDAPPHGVTIGRR